VVFLAEAEVLVAEEAVEAGN